VNGRSGDTAGFDGCVGIGTALLHLLALTGASVALPLYEVLSGGSHFFVARRSGPSDILTLVALISVLVRGVLVGIEALAGAIRRRLQVVLHLILVAALVALYLLRLLNAVAPLPLAAGVVAVAPLPLAAGVAAVVAGALAAVLLYVRLRGVRLFLSMLAPVALLLPLVFLLRSPVFELVFPAERARPVGVALDRTPPIVMLVLDELPLLSLLDGEGAIDRLRFPNFAKLADTSYWFRYAGTSGDTTPLAVGSILTGQLPVFGKPGTYRHHPGNLFTLLGEAYDFNVWETATEFLPEEYRRRGPPPPYGPRIRALLLDVAVVYLHVVTPHALAHRLPDISDTWGSFMGPARSVNPPQGQGRDAWETLLHGLDRGRTFEAFIASIRRSSRPTIHYHHTALPHAPWVYLPSGELHTDPTLRKRARPGAASRKGGGRRQRRSGDEMRLYHQRHLVQTGYVDQLLGRLRVQLEQQGLFDEALIVVVADHGVAFTPGEYIRAPGPKTFPEVLFVPLLIKLPEQRAGVVSDANAGVIDILPSIADLLGARVPWLMNGSSLLAESRRELPKKILASSQDKRIRRYPFANAIRMLERLKERNSERFDLASPERSFHRFGDFSDVLGRSVGELRVVDAARGATLDRSAEMHDVDLAAPLLPALVSGRLEGPQSATSPETVAIALNGVVQAVTEVHVEDGQTRFAALLPEAAFRSGPNRAELFVIERRAGGEPLLRRIALQEPRASRTARPSAEGD